MTLVPDMLEGQPRAL